MERSRSPEIHGYDIELEPANTTTPLPPPSAEDAAELFQWKRYARAVDVLNGRDRYEELPDSFQEREALNTLATIPPMLRIARQPIVQ